MPRLFYTDPTEIPEELKNYYHERDGKWVLDLEDPVVPKKKLDEFRNNNIRLMKELDSLKSKLKDVDPEEYQALKKKMKELEEKKLIDAGKIDELLQRKELEIKQKFENKIKSLSEELQQYQKTANTYKERLARTVIDSEVQRAVLSVAKPKKGAINDILLRAKTTWKIDEEGNPLPVDERGEVLKNEDGPITFREWAENLVTEAPYLFEGSNGGGATGGSSSTGSKVIDINDRQAFIENLEDIAKGKVKVNM